MKQPLWILNSALLFVLLICLSFIFFYSPKFPKKQSLKPIAAARDTRQKVSSIDRSKIYLNDLFNTYQPPVVHPKEPELVKALPTPPQPSLPPAPQPPTPKFLEPLSITLTGIFYLDDETKSSAFLMDNKSKVEKKYHVGDEIADAQILKIHSNRVILIRSNGQQETLFLKKADVDQHVSPWFKKSWSHIIRKKGPLHYAVDKKKFVQEVPSLAQLVDLLDLTTVYKQGIPVGCKIGRVDDNSLVQSLGLSTGDIIQTINNTPAATTDNRLEIYKQITTSQDQPITIKLLRKGQQVVLTISVEQFQETSVPLFGHEKDTGSEQVPEQSKQEDKNKVDILKRSKQFAPTYQQLAQMEQDEILGHNKAKQRRLFR